MKNSLIKNIIYQTLILFFSAVVISIAINAIRPNGLDIFSHADKKKPVAPGILKIDMDTVVEKITRPEVLIIDARPEAEYSLGHIKGAKNFPYNGFDGWIEDFIDTVDPQREIIIYCSGPLCSQASEVAELLFVMGYENISYFPGGMERWLENKLPVESLNSAHPEME